MQPMKRQSLLILAALLLGLLLISCSGGEGEAAGGASTGGNTTGAPVIRMAVTTDPDGLDPHATASASTFQVTSNIYETLVTVDEQGVIIPALAESWTVSEDGLVLTFTLREGATFSNGLACDAQAVKASFERLLSQGVRSQDYSGISGIDVIDERTISFTFSELNVSALTLFAYPWAAVVDASAQDLRTNPVGTGPYMLSSWVPQQELLLTANPSYTGVRHVDNVEFIMMPDMTSQVTALRGGQVDIILVTGDLVGQFEGDDAWSILAAPGNGLQLMAMNNASPALSDVRVRQAINHAVDKDALIEGVWWGYGEPIGSHFPVVLSEYVDTNGLYPYNPDRARELLAEAGYVDGLTLEMYLPRNYQEYVNAGLVIADYLKAVGINVSVQIVEWATWLSDIYNGRGYDLTVVGHTGRLDAYSLLSRYRSSSAENYLNYSDPAFDALLDEYSVTVDEARRTEIAHEMQQRLAEAVPGLYIQDPIQIYVTPSSLKGFKVFPINIFAFNEVYFSQE